MKKNALFILTVLPPLTLAYNLVTQLANNINEISVAEMLETNVEKSKTILTI